MNAALEDYALRARRPGLTLVVSDMFSRDGGYLDGLNALLSRGHEVAFVHVLAPEEVQPPVAGDLSLVDVETELQQEVTVDGAMLGIYQQRLAAWRRELRDECLRRGAHYFPLETDRPWERLILSDMRRRGWSSSGGFGLRQYFGRFGLWVKASQHRDQVNTFI